MERIRAVRSLLPGKIVMLQLANNSMDAMQPCKLHLRSTGSRARSENIIHRHDTTNLQSSCSFTKWIGGIPSEQSRLYVQPATWRNQRYDGAITFRARLIITANKLAARILAAFSQSTCIIVTSSQLMYGSPVSLTYFLIFCAQANCKFTARFSSLHSSLFHLII